MRKLTTAEFIVKATAAHAGRYSYAKSVYVGQSKNVVITCLEHGDFEQTPGNHISAKKGCMACGRKITEESRKLTDEEFKKRVTAIHGASVDLARGTYVGWQERVLCDCVEHGEYLALPAVLLRGGKGCMQCAINERGPERLTREEFIERAVAVHGDTFSYSEVSYDTFLKDVEIVCKKHGSFFQTPCNHIRGSGCSKCSAASQSKPEIELLEYIKANYVGKTVERTRKVISPLELDMYFPDKHLAIEFNGLYWHSADRHSDLIFKKKHVDKLQKCTDAGIRLIQFREDKYAARPDVCRSIVANALGFATQAVYARNCSVVALSNEVGSRFLQEHHLDGTAKASVYYGLEIDSDLVSVMSFGVPRFSSDYEWELLRFASKKFYRVVGGAGKLMKAFRSTHSGAVVSYCNLEHGTGNVYEAIGMTSVGASSPNYIWVKNGQKAYTRYQTQKHKLSSLLKSFDVNESESVNMFNNGFKRYWDSGNRTYAFKDVE